MARDYARTPRASRDDDTGRGPSGVVWLLVGILIGLIIAGIFYLKNQSTPHHPPAAENEAQPAAPVGMPQTQAPQAANTTPAALPKATAKKTPSTQQLQTQFDFYNVLPSQKVIGPSGDEDTSAMNNNAPAQNQNTQAPQPAASTPPPSTQPAPPQTVKPKSAPNPPPQLAPVVSIQPSAPAPASATYVIQTGSYSTFDEADRARAQLTLLGFEVHVTAVQKNGKTLQRVWLGPYATRAEADDMQKQLRDNLISGKILKSN